MITAGIGSKLMLYHMALEISHLAKFQNAIFTHRRCPHQFRAGKVIIRIGDDGLQVLDDTTLHRLVDAIAEIACVRMTEIGLHTVRECIEGSADNLLHRNCFRQVWVEDGKVGEAAPERTLLFLFLIRNHGSIVLFRTRAAGSHDDSERNKFGWNLVLHILIVPDIAVEPRLCRDYLAAVAHRATTHSKDEIDPLHTSQPCALQHLCISGIRHDAT